MREKNWIIIKTINEKEVEIIFEKYKINFIYTFKKYFYLKLINNHKNSRNKKIFILIMHSFLMILNKIINHSLDICYELFLWSMTLF
jgi:hypothetical protein